MKKILMVPGINGSGPDHWQTRWEADGELATVRINPTSWDEPDLDDWCAAIDRGIADSDPGDVLIVAHSLGCLAVVHWLHRASGAGVRGAFLVAPPDPGSGSFPAVAGSFARVPMTVLPVPAVVVASDDDQYCSVEAGLGYAGAWSVERISVGNAGHLNTASGLGDWPAGRGLLTAFAAGLVRVPRGSAARRGGTRTGSL